ncbi:DUF423 domain-containing protein [Gorillibacterium massiliense]|uniref:DUF423 domain-containing protein n=1 Tax=Gorillibacterium massiliense TaxID=1280390 RepID=UPI000593320C|nr:DUF423 domain-containing protein [Gorillibacterium massiliense]
MRKFIVAGCIIMFLGVALGAFGAHILKDRLDTDMMDVYHTGVLYHLVHGVGLLAVGLAGRHLAAEKLVRWSGWLLIAGIILFSGSLYILAITGVKGLGAITPLGGVAFLAGWACLAVAAWKEKA